MIRTTASSRADRRWLELMVMGMAAFLVGTLVLRSMSCHNILDVSWGSGCGTPPTAAAIACATLIELVLVGLLFTQPGRRVVGGFLLAFVISAMFMRVSPARLWLAPAYGAAHAARPLWAPYQAERQRNVAQEAWVGVHRTQHPTLVHAARLVNAVHECAERFHIENDTASFPRSVTELVRARNCESLQQLEIDDAGVPSRFTDIDNGWRWSYDAAPADAGGNVAGYSVRVFEDPILARPAPEFSGDETGVVRETRPGSPPMLVASPVASLVMLRRCLTRVPAENERLAARRGWRPRSRALWQVGNVCPELRGHISVDLEGNGDNGTLALPVHEQAGEIVDTAAVYTTVFTPADVDGLIFELNAMPRPRPNKAIHSGTRLFFIARDGSVHVRTGAGLDGELATISDPIAPECLPGGGVDCGIAHGEVEPVPGS